MPLPSKRDPEQLRADLQRWFAERMGDDVTVGPLATPDGNGMSSETLLFDLTQNGVVDHLVARLRPDMSDWPVFPVYELGKQAAAMRLAHAHSSVPVPEVLWVEDDDAALGAPFLVMRRVSGKALPDMPPYVFGGSFMDDFTSVERRELQRNATAALAQLHAIDRDAVAAAGIGPVGESGQESLSRQLAELRANYDWARTDWAFGDQPVPVIERAFAWLDAHRPSEVGPTVLNWGDARPGNILFDGTRPAAVLDWEMVNVGPAAIDVGWFVFLHEFFQGYSTFFELPGFPDFCRPEDVHADYVAAGGQPIVDLDWYVTFAAARFAVISLRTESREVAYGNRAAHETPDEMVMQGTLLAGRVAQP